MLFKFKGLFLLILLFAVPAIGQQRAIDSLTFLLQKETNPERTIELLGTIGERYFDSQIYHDSAFYYTEKAYSLAKEHDNEDEEGRALFNLGLIYTSLGNFEMALQKYKATRDIVLKLGDSRNLSVIYSNIGGLYLDMKDFPNAKDNYERAIEISLRENDSIGLAIDYINLGETSFLNGEIETSRSYLERSLELLELLEMDFASVHLNYGRVFLALQNQEEAKKEALLSLKLAKEDDNLKAVSEASELLYTLYKQEENYEEALTYYKEHAVLRDSLRTAKELSKVEILELNSELSKNREKLALASQKTTLTNFIYILVAIGAVLITVLLFRQLKIIRISKEMQAVQEKLLKEELEHRKVAKSNRNATSFDATLAQDREL
ncbi:tetratricopeptide repeat protein [Ulvibacter litoralis]|uniref:Tetratricopeptide repeat-containing protein n=1 Tax=Ulvibacter litoralis TaxID=227084 RepID=A0A1G7CQR9_9FLAO|nr:tetratricopeptide repeat protein [Ulvibacter litoralis]GHC46461.1 hypothetical protein GCM10008083_06870 [Ulvibacter litoralis]SDE41649.1 Tetratricopeptide repeat-containing protein [Ulvibacter litoralis]